MIDHTLVCVTGVDESPALSRFVRKLICLLLFYSFIIIKH